MPTELEQDIAETYCKEHKLDRPNTNTVTAVIAVLLFVLATVLFVLLIHFSVTKPAVFALLPICMQEFYNSHTLGAVIIIVVGVITAELFVVAKYAVIGIIKLYQHYAPEEIRRRCLCMPTCSEYAIMAIRKYGVIIGVCKGYYHFVYLCRGNIYRIYYP
jgi:uncharacterized membrane protein YidH (DUF202 family)